MRGHSIAVLIRRRRLWGLASIAALALAFVLGGCMTWHDLSEDDARDRAIWCEQHGLSVSIWRDEDGHVVRMECDL